MSVDIHEPLQHDAAAGHPLIDGPDGLTPEWVTAVLRGQGVLQDASATRVETEAVGNGLLGANLRLTLDYDADEGAPATLVAKMASQEEQSRESGAALGLYTRETRFYQELAPQIVDSLARTYFADVSADGKSFCLLFDDMSPGRMGDQLAGCSLQDAQTAMVSAAHLHAPLWGDEQLEKLDWLSGEPMQKLYVDMLPPYVPTAAERFEKWLEPGAIDVATRFGEKIADYFTHFERPWTISHQDFRLDNLIFDAQDGRIPLAVLDWQTCIPGPGALDAVYFNGAGLLEDVRADNEEDLARLYHSELTEKGVTGYDWDACWRDYRMHAGHGLIMSIVGAAITAPTERGDEMLSALINRTARQMTDLDTLSLF